MGLLLQWLLLVWSTGFRALGPGNQASCRREAKDSALLSSRDEHLLEPTLWPKGSQASCEVWREDLGPVDLPNLGIEPGSPALQA